MPPSYTTLMASLAADRSTIVAEVVVDVAGPEDDPTAVAALVRPAVDALLAGLAGAPLDARASADTGAPAGSALDAARLREEGAAAARRGEGVAAPIDRYLSSGWAIWDAATRHPAADGASLAALGAALLRAGDAAAAAIAEGHGAAGLEIARRTASARRAFADDLLDLAPGDRDGLARLARRAPGFGLDPVGRFAVFAAWLGRDIEDAGPEAERIDRALTRPPARGPGRPPPATAGSAARSDARSVAGPAAGAAAVPPTPIVAARHGRLVLVLPETPRVDAIVGRLLADLAEGAGWVGVRGAAADGLAAVTGTVGDALDALAVVERRGSVSRVVGAGEVALERALAADPALLAAAVEEELGPLVRAPRGGAALVDTIAAFLASRQNVRATARVLGVAPRTVSYRLARVEALLGRPLDGRAIGRLAAALLARDVLNGAS